MVLLILHLIGDFVLQNDWMAEHKTKFTREGFLACFVHCLVYSAPFYSLNFSVEHTFLVFITHFIIDKFRLAYYWCEFMNVGARLENGHWLKTYLIFQVDMCFHLICNYLIFLI